MPLWPWPTSIHRIRSLAVEREKYARPKEEAIHYQQVQKTRC